MLFSAELNNLREACNTRKHPKINIMCHGQVVVDYQLSGKEILTVSVISLIEIIHCLMLMFGLNKLVAMPFASRCH